MNGGNQISQQEFEQIESYLRGKLSPEERTTLSSRLEVDFAFRSNMNEVRLLILGISEYKLWEKMNEFHQRYQKITKAHKVASRRYWLAAACVVALLGVFLTWIYTRPSEHEKLYSQYFQADPGLMTTMGQTDEYEFNRAMVDYKSGDYKAAISAWEKMIEADPTNDSLNYFLGLSYLGNDESSKAIPYLRLVTDDDTSEFKTEAYWYLGLAFLKEGRILEARNALGNSDRDQRDELLSRIKE